MDVPDGSDQDEHCEGVELAGKRSSGLVKLWRDLSLQGLEISALAMPSHPIKKSPTTEKISTEGH